MIASRVENYNAGDFTVHFHITIQQLSFMNTNKAENEDSRILNHGTSWFLHHHGLNKALDLSFKRRCKTNGCVVFQQQALVPRWKAATTKTEGGRVRMIGLPAKGRQETDCSLINKTLCLYISSAPELQMLLRKGTIGTACSQESFKLW